MAFCLFLLAKLIFLDGKLIWDRKQESRFPEVPEMKRKIRDVLCPDRKLGHNESTKGEIKVDDEFDEFDDDEAADMRSFYGVL